ncbi:proline-rich protein [Mycena crocata]|nr:proline-rich protein [Mycena crocata]
MGRALFSETYGYKAPAIRVEAEPLPVCPDKWSVYNRFDPDSDEFFEGAEYEAFVDQEGLLEQPVAVAELLSNSSDSSSASSDSGESTSPVAPPVRMTAIWDQLAADIPGYAPPYLPRITDSNANADDDDEMLASASPPHAPSSLRNSTTATDLGLAHRVPDSPRRISVPPISIPAAQAPSTPSPASESDVSPRTPPAVHALLPLVTPSPPPTVTPRIYMWGPRTAHATPGSPSVRHTHSAGPLTNPAARQSLARIPRRLVQNVAI